MANNNKTALMLNGIQSTAASPVGFKQEETPQLPVNASFESLVKEIAESVAKILTEQAQSPLVIHGKMFQLVGREELAKHFIVSTDTIDRWVKSGVLPQPFDPEMRKGSGNKVLRWDLYSCIDAYCRFQRN